MGTTANFNAMSATTIGTISQQSAITSPVPYKLLPRALATFCSLCELTIMRLSFLLEQLVRLTDIGL